MMNREQVVDHMISFIEEKERDYQAASLIGESKVNRTEIVNSIIKELEREVNNED